MILKNRSQAGTDL